MRGEEAHIRGTGSEWGIRPRIVQTRRTSNAFPVILTYAASRHLAILGYRRASCLELLHVAHLRCELAHLFESDFDGGF
jgi:hypothetical protein